MPIALKKFLYLIPHPNLFLFAMVSKCIDSNKDSLEELVNLLTSNAQEKEIIMTSIAHPYIQQGIQYEKLEIAKNMLWEHRYRPKATGLSKEELEKLSKVYS